MIHNSRFFRRVAIPAIAAACWAGGAAAAAQLAHGVGALAVWREPAGARTPTCEGRNNDSRGELACVTRIMKTSGATAGAIEFARRVSAQLGEICYLANLRSFGPVPLATIALPFRRNTNAHTDDEYVIVNGDPTFIRVDNKGAVQSALARSPAWLQLTRKHPNIDIWEGTVFAGGHSLPGGGYRLVFSYPLGDYHAAAGEWNASVAFDFAPGGTFLGRKLLAISGPRQ